MLSYPSKQLNVLFLLLIMVLCFISFYPSFKEPLYGETYVVLYYELGAPFRVLQFFSPYPGQVWNPLPRLGYYLAYHLFDFNALGYRVVNLIFHIIISFLVFYLCKLITKNEIVSVAAALIFATHFAHWEIAIHTSIIGHFAMVFFYMLTLIFFYKFITRKKRIFYIVTLLTFIFAIFSSQAYVSLIFVMLALEILINRKKIKDIFRLKVILKYAPFMLLTVLHALGSILIQLGTGSAHNPFDSESLFTFHAPVVKNLIMYLLELFIPIFGSNMPIMLKRVLSLSVILIILVLFVKGSRKVQFCIFWMFVGQFIFLFWAWPIPMSRYTYLSSIPFSILIGMLVLEVYNKIRIHQKWKNIYKFSVALGLSFYIAVNCLAYNVSSKVREFNVSGRNSTRLLKNFQDLYPTIPDEAFLYFNGLPENEFFRYGCWSYEDSLELFLSLFYKNKFTVKFLKKDEMENMIRNSKKDNKDIFIKFDKNRLHDISPHRANK